jgi:hypothetical protein
MAQVADNHGLSSGNQRRNELKDLSETPVYPGQYRFKRHKPPGWWAKLAHFLEVVDAFEGDLVIIR